MVWPRTVLDGIVICVIFNVMVAFLFLLSPGSFSKMLPSGDLSIGWIHLRQSRLLAAINPETKIGEEGTHEIYLL